MTIYKAISTEIASKGQLLGTSKKPTIVNGKLTAVCLSKEQFIEKMKNTQWKSFEVHEVN